MNQLNVSPRRIHFWDIIFLGQYKFGLPFTKKRSSVVTLDQLFLLEMLYVYVSCVLFTLPEMRAFCKIFPISVVESSEYTAMVFNI